MLEMASENLSQIENGVSDGSPTKEIDQLTLKDIAINGSSNGESDPTFDFGSYPVKIEVNSILGRYLVASRDIKCGEILLRDQAIFSSPNAGDDGHTCLGCGVMMPNPDRCGKCAWPVCNADCANKPSHKNNECEIFSQNGITPDLPSPFCFVAGAEFIKVLRGLLLSSGRTLEDQRNWKLLQNLESHIETRKSIPKILFMSTLSKNFIRELCKLPEFDEASIDFILGVIDVNAFRHTIHPNNPLRAVQASSARDVERNATFLYSKASMAAHGCRRNVRWETLMNGSLEMWAAEDVKSGDLLTHPYVDLMQGTPDRRRQLKDQFYFDCSCPRCSDPTELGTFFSALKCPECKSGYLLATDPLDYETSWKCTNPDGSCSCIKTSEYERELIQKIKSEEKTVLEVVAASGSNLAVIGGLARILGKYEGKLVHQNHYVIIDVEYNLVKRMSKVGKPTVDLMHEMRRMIHKYLDVAVVFYPGIK